MARVDSFLQRLGFLFDNGNFTIDDESKQVIVKTVPLYPIVQPSGTVVAKTGNYTIVTADFGKIFTNTGAVATITLTLPAATSALKGKVLKVAVLAAQQINVSPAAADGVFLNGSGVDNKDVQIPGVVSNYVDIYCDGTNYLITHYNGVVVKEA